MSRRNWKQGLRNSIARSSRASEQSAKNSVETEALVQRRLRTQEKLLRLAHKTELKNIKSLMMQDASNYVRESMEKLIKVMSRDHRQLASQFSHFRNRALDVMDTMDGYYRLLLEAELTLA